MAQIWLGSFINSKSKDEEVEAQPGQMPTYRYRRKRTYYIIADTGSENEDDILANSNIPDLGDTSALGYPVKTRSAKEVEYVIHPITGAKTTLWEIEVASDSTLNFAFAGTPVSSPLEFPPKYKWTFKEREVDFDYDVVTGKPISNVNGEPIFITRKILYPVLNVTRYESYYTDLAALNGTYANTLNDLQFGPFARGICLMNPIEAEEEVFDLAEEGVGEEGQTLTFLKVTYVIECLCNDYYAGGPGASSPWINWQLNQGYYVRDKPGDPPHLNVFEGTKTLVNLALDGTALPLDADPIWLPFNEFKFRDWTPLGLAPVPDEPDPPDPPEP